MSFIICVSKSLVTVWYLSYPQLQREDTGREFRGLAHRLHLGEK